jgi:hypothetical protein
MMLRSFALSLSLSLLPIALARAQDTTGTIEGDLLTEVRSTSSPYLDETSLRYEGWRIALASGVGVFVSFASLLVYTFGIFLKPLAEEFSWSREAVSARSA